MIKNKFIFFNLFLCSFLCPLHSYSEQKFVDGVAVEIFNGYMNLPKGFVLINRDSDAHYFRKRIDPDSTSLIEMGVVNPVKDRRNHPKSLGSVEFEMVDKIVKENFTIEVWSPKQRQVLSGEFFTTILYDSKEYMKIIADSPALWLDIVNSYKSKDAIPDLSAQNHFY